MHDLTIFYDSACPLCLKEMRQLKSYDVEGRIGLVDIYEPDFDDNYPQINRAEAGKILHALSTDGDLILGLDVTCRAWEVVGRHRWLKLTRLPLIQPIADSCYRFFARHRYRISFILTGKSRCDRCSI